MIGWRDLKGLSATAAENSIVMNTTLLFIGGLMLGILVTLTILSHMGTEDQRGQSRRSSGRPRLQPKREELEEVNLRDNSFVPTPTGDSLASASVEKGAFKTANAAAPLWTPREEANQEVKGSTRGMMEPKKREPRSPIQAGPTTWAPGGEGALQGYAKKAEKVAKHFGGEGSSTQGAPVAAKVVPATRKHLIPTTKSPPPTKPPSIISAKAATYKDTPYHRQAREAPVPPRNFSFDIVEAGKRPDMSGQRAAHEKDDLKLHLCNSVFEAYSASYLTTREHMLDVKSEDYNLTWVNCEMASFIHMKHSNNFYKNPHGRGMIMQSLDVLDFSVIHLSAFERSSRRWKDKLWSTLKERKTAWHNIDAVKHTAKVLEEMLNPKLSGRKLVWSPEAKKTVVVMPFLGGAMGAGHSELGNRFEYLKACFWSFYEFIPNIVAGVSRQEDVDWAWRESGLPFYDIILISNLPKSAGLPVGTTQQVKKRLESGAYDFDYIMFTESDQILISRELPRMHDHLKRFPHRMLLPHRLMPYSDRVITEVHGRSKDQPENAWMKQSCCLPRQNCGERKSWKSIRDPVVPFIDYYGLNVPLGNVNFLDESYRYCSLGDYTEICP